MLNSQTMDWLGLVSLSFHLDICVWNLVDNCQHERIVQYNIIKQPIPWSLYLSICHDVCEFVCLWVCASIRSNIWSLHLSHKCISIKQKENCVPNSNRIHALFAWNLHLNLKQIEIQRFFLTKSQYIWHKWWSNLPIDSILTIAKFVCIKLFSKNW